MKSVLIGSVSTSQVVLEELIAAGCPPEMVFSLDEVVSANVSGYYPIHETAQAHGIPWRKFRKIGDREHAETIASLAPDYIFVVGLSQIVGESILEAAKKGVVGLHPAPLPKYRGRAAMVWQMLLGLEKSAVSLFLIDEGTDSGPILGQEPFLIGSEDYAEDMERNCLVALRTLLRRVIPQLRDGTVQPVPQREEEATWLLRRSPEDGAIDWEQPIADIHRLIRAVSRPYPGAFSHYDGKRLVTFWRAEMEKNPGYIGFPGQVAEKDENSFAILCRDGLLRVTDWTCEEAFCMYVGHRFRQKGEVR
ncbi:MAG: methionyl-tRNA formyltransferase [Lachnospiraceae bacterium]|nr:methionyl-tRNA formyltransferase [Lachnospiraceae bacterium]